MAVNFANIASQVRYNWGVKAPGPLEVSTLGQRVSTDPGRAGDPNLAPETPGQTALANQQAALDAKAAEDAANAAAERARGAANANEADAYGMAAGIAGGNADLEMQAAAITALQQARLVRTSIGSQFADVATSGFKEAGSNLSLLRDSMAQGGITDALTRIQGNINAAGYRGQQAASLGEQAAAEGASQAAMILAQQYADAGVLATSTSANLAAQLAANPQLTGAGQPAAVPSVGGVTGFSVRPSSGGQSNAGGVGPAAAYNPVDTLSRGGNYNIEGGATGKFIGPQGGAASTDTTVVGTSAAIAPSDSAAIDFGGGGDTVP